MWACSDWEAFGRYVGRTRKGAASHRPAVCSRFVVQRALLDDFLDVYLPALRSVRFGHPLAVASPEDPLPELDLGPLGDAGSAGQVHERIRQAVGEGAVLLHQGSLDEGRFLPGQDTSAYAAPAALLAPLPSSSHPSSPLHPSRPYAPVGVIVPVDTEAELFAALNASETAAGATLFTDDPGILDRFASRTRPVRTGHPAGRGPRTDSEPEGDPLRRRPDRPPERAARRKPRRAARSPGITEVKTAAGAWYGCPRRHGRAGRRTLSGWRNGRRASLRC
ncbi:aldehyde dehydrogenase family protein [Streptomyces marispadix]|uniref:aldehyde dehydrogenase family protein n=1 Tax=Streptomyces marispadix TaxID=2922868 RepID=UPI003556D456